MNTQNNIKYKQILNKECSICLEVIQIKKKKFNFRNNFIKLKCNHIFHKSCINEWYKVCKNKKTELICPYCRNIININDNNNNLCVII